MRMEKAMRVKHFGCAGRLTRSKRNIGRINRPATEGAGILDRHSGAKFLRR